MNEHYRAQDLITLATDLLKAGGLESSLADIVANTLVEGELLGFSTHGLQLLPVYLQSIEEGGMAKHGDPSILVDHGHAMTWDGNWLPGPVVMKAALETAYDRVGRSATVTVAIRRSGHIGCLGTYAQDAAQRGYFLLLTCSDPSVETVVPHGAVQGRMTPNPIAAGWPTETIPVVIDVSPSMATNGLVNRHKRAGERCPAAWLIDGDGRATDDPNAMGNPAGGGILPLGGMDLGYKGFALGLMVEALTSAMAGSGRANPEKQYGASIFLMLINPAMFGGDTEFRHETQWLADSCRSAKPRPGSSVRLPGERSHAAKQSALRDGVVLHPETMPAVAKWAQKFGVQMPKPQAM